MTDEELVGINREAAGLVDKMIVGKLDDAGARRMVELQEMAGNHFREKQQGDEAAVATQAQGEELAAMEALRKRFDALYVDSLIAHKWFENVFGRQLMGRDFAVKIPMADAGLSEVTRDRDALVAENAKLRTAASDVLDAIRSPMGAALDTCVERLQAALSSEAVAERLEFYCECGRSGYEWNPDYQKAHPEAVMPVFCSDCGRRIKWLSAEAVAAKPTRNSEKLASFVKYCEEHPEERFWQALRNWSGYWSVIAVPRFDDFKTIETFNIE